MSEIDDQKAKQSGATGLTPVRPLSKGSELVPVFQPVKDAELKSGGASAISVLARLMRMIGDLLTSHSSGMQSPPPPQLEQSLFKVLVAGLEADVDGSAQAHLIQSFANRTALKLQPYPKSFAFDSPEDPLAASALQTALRHAVASEGGHLMIWGGMNPEGYRLRFSTAQADDGAFGLRTRLELPVTFAEPAINVLYAATLAAMEAVTESQKSWIRQALPTAALQAEELASRPSVQMSMAQQRSVQIVYGHIALAAADCVSEREAPEWFERAVTSYRSAQKRVDRNDPVWESGLIHRHLGSALTTRAENSKEPIPIFKEAVEEWRQAVESLTRASMPQEWALSQIRLSNALYRLDLVTGDSELLREALQALQGALQVYSRTETPQKWADTMHDMAQILQIYGDQLKSPEVLKKSIETCDSVLQIYSQERTPLSWAKTKNTLGAALFLFDRHKGGKEHLDEAQASIEAALAVFRAHGAKGPAQVAERNLAHIHRLKGQRKNHTIADPDWSNKNP